MLERKDPLGEWNLYPLVVVLDVSQELRPRLVSHPNEVSCFPRELSLFCESQSSLS